MKCFRLSAEARADLDEIWIYNASERGEAAADRIINFLTERFLLLAAMPGIGHTRTDLTNSPVRFWTSLPLPYQVIYRPDPTPLYVVAVLHHAQDIAAILSQGS